MEEKILVDAHLYLPQQSLRPDCPNRALLRLALAVEVGQHILAHGCLCQLSDLLHEGPKTVFGAMQLSEFVSVCGGRGGRVIANVRISLTPLDDSQELAGVLFFHSNTF